MLRRSRAIAFAGTLLVLAACQDTSDPLSPARPDLSAAVGGAQGPPEAPDLDVLDRAIPGFGGFFLDNTGASAVYLTDARARGAAEQALGAYLRARGQSPSQLRVLPGRYAYRQLQRWFGGASAEALAVPGAVYADLQEGTNRLEFGVENQTAAAGLRGVTRRLGIPDDAVTVVETEPIVPMTTLRERVRPILGGLQINFPGFLCTLGFNARHGTDNSFLTNSHCTTTQGGVENTPYWQPLESVDPVQIGTEVEDPAYKRNLPGCPRGRKCRFSDAARANYAAGIPFTLGQIEQTTGLGSITIAGAYTITTDDLRTNFTIGETLNKVGRTTGWTQGTVSNTCVNTGVSGTSIVQLCQTFVSGGGTVVGGGDSGSNVFRILLGSDVALAGLLWGGNTSGTLFVFSPLANIERTDEIGPLTTH